MMRRFLIVLAMAAVTAGKAQAQAVYEPAPPPGQAEAANPDLQQPNNSPAPGMPPDAARPSAPLNVPPPPAIAGTGVPSAATPLSPSLAPGQGMDVQEPEEGDGMEQPKGEMPPAPQPLPAPTPPAATKPGENGDTQFSAVVLQGLNKVTAHTETIIAPIGEVVRFGTIEIVAHVCWKSAPEDRPENAALLEISGIKQGEEPKQIFLGWMFASSPGLSSLEHPFYDITVVRCSKTGGEDLSEQPPAKPAPGTDKAARKAKKQGQ